PVGIFDDDAPAPVRRAVEQVLAGEVDSLVRDRTVEERFPRAEQLRIAAVGLALHGTINQATIARAFEHVRVDFSPDRWPDLRTDATFLARWLDHPAEWTTAHGMALRATLASDEEIVGSLLSAVLRHIHARFDEGAFREALHPVTVAEQLAQALPDQRRLAIFLGMLRQRLDWIEHGRLPAGMLVALWQDASLTPRERQRVASDLLEVREPLPQQIAIDAQFYLLTHLEDSD